MLCKVAFLRELVFLRVVGMPARPDGIPLQGDPGPRGPSRPSDPEA